ncbi:unnamed protein product [Leptidea sinapis]|uniref:UDP-glucuronosyltransferase n=1 Tax=Leptidea sinapis TaxID=189913 RepID=A0A5E4QY18_9NEOP|nr:unnamed protein product [Leptidea sinapis]
MMTMKVLLLMFLVSSAAGYHILCLHTTPSSSHYQLMRGIVNPLLEAGHQVTLITLFPEKKPATNLTIVDASHLIEYSKDIDVMDPDKFDIGVLKTFARNLAIGGVESAAVREAIVNHQYDAVVTEWFFSDLHAGFAAVQQAPWIMLSGAVLHLSTERLMDSVRSLSTIPDMFNIAPIPMNFWQRIANSIMYLVVTVDNWINFPSAKSDYESTFGPLAARRGVPLAPFEEVYNNISIMFVNSHPSYAPARSQPPNVIDIAGFHIDDNTPALPKDIQAIMDSSPQGVIYFSMGSIMKSTMLTEERKRGLLQIFAELPYTVLWKFETELDGLPKNVYIRPWMPQNSILAHPNTKVFITHGGLLSTIEALKYGVPMLIIPVYGDQPGNARRSVMSGLALEANFYENLVAEMRVALKELLANESYYKTAKSTSALFNERPVHTSKLITHYVELAIKTKGAYHLRSKTKLYAWYELMMLDQLFLVLAILYLLKYTAQRIIRLFSSKSSRTKKNQ